MRGVHRGLPVRGGVVGSAAMPGRDARQPVAEISVEPRRVRGVPCRLVVLCWLTSANALPPWLLWCYSKASDVRAVPRGQLHLQLWQHRMRGVHRGLPVRGGVVGSAAMPGRDARQPVAEISVEP